MRKCITLYDIVTELQTWGDFTEDELARAKVSKKTTSNDSQLRTIIIQWENGKYDEDINILIAIIKTMIP